MPQRHDLDPGSGGSQWDLDMDEATRGIVRRWVVVRHVTVWHPPTDVYELNDQLVVTVEIAGMREGDFNVTLHHNRLLISGIRKRNTPSDASYHQLEIAFGEFRTEVSLPWPVERDKVTATYRDGFLKIVLPRAVARSVHIVNLDESESDELSESGESSTQG